METYRNARFQAHWSRLQQPCHSKHTQVLIYVTHGSEISSFTEIFDDSVKVTTKLVQRCDVCVDLVVVSAALCSSMRTV